MTTEQVRNVISQYEDKIIEDTNNVIEFVYTLIAENEEVQVNENEESTFVTYGGHIIVVKRIYWKNGDVYISNNTTTASIHQLTSESLIRLSNLIIEHKERTIRKQYMGYSHKFKLLNHDKELFAKASSIFKEALQFLPEKNRNIFDSDNNSFGPTITTDKICFNGVMQECEWFSIYPDMEKSDYCKTARLPYDAAVCLCLIVFFKLYGRKGFQFDTDGNLNNDGTEDWEQTTEGWAIAKKAYNKYCRSKKIPVPNYSMWVLGIKDE